MNDTTVMQEKVGNFKLRSLIDGIEHPLESGDLLVGREVECNVTLDSSHISRYHAKMAVSSMGIVVEDLRSTNGTFINGKRLSTPQTLSVGDEIRFHEIPFRLVSNKDESGSAEKTVFQSFGTVAPSSNQAVKVSLSAEEIAAQIPVADLEEVHDHTRLLSPADLERLQDKAERQRSIVDLGSGPRLVVLSAPIRGKSFLLRADVRNDWLLGRGEQCDFVISDKTVSSSHARMRRLDGEWVLEACEGKNPIIVNNRTVEFSPLHPGDKVRIGRMEMVFRSDEKPVIPVEDMLEEKMSVPWFNLSMIIGALLVFGLMLGLLINA